MNERLPKPRPLPSALFFGKNGFWNESHAQRAVTESWHMATSIATWGIHRLLPHPLPLLREVHGYLGPHIEVCPDNTARYDDPELLRTHDFFDREGTLIQTLRNKGAETIGELQTLLFFWTAHIVPSEFGAVDLQDWIYGKILKTVMLVTGEDGGGRKKAESLITSYMDQVAYHKLITRVLRQNPDLVQEFIESPDFVDLKERFSDQHMAAYQEADETVATAILAGHYLSVFEKVSNGFPYFRSPSQRYIEKVEDYHEKIAGFLEKAKNRKTNQPKKNTRETFGELTADFHAAVEARELPPDEKIAVLNSLNAPTSLPTMSNDKRNALIELFGRYDECLYRPHEAQLYRHKIDQRLIRIWKEVDPKVVTDPSSRRSFIQTIIANNVMVKTQNTNGPEYTAKAWLPESEGYLGEDSKRQLPGLKKIEREVSVDEFTETVMNVFNGEGAYEAQVKRIYDAAPVVFRFMEGASEYPTFAKRITILGDKSQIAKSALRRMDSIWDQDINSLNRFFRKGGLRQAQKVLTLWQVFEFLHGIETNYLLLTRGRVEGMERIFARQWENNRLDDPTILKKAISETLKDGEHRTLIMDHDKSERYQAIKDYEEGLQQSLWNSFETWFKRWDLSRNSINILLQVAVECICLFRYTFSNPKMLRQM